MLHADPLKESPCDTLHLWISLKRSRVDVRNALALLSLAPMRIGVISLEAKDLVLELGHGPRSRIPDARQVAPVSQLYRSATSASTCPSRISLLRTECEVRTHFIALIIGGGPHNNTLPPLPCSAEPTPAEGMAVSIISRVTKPVAWVQPAGGLLRAYCMSVSSVWRGQGTGRSSTVHEREERNG